MDKLQGEGQKFVVGVCSEQTIVHNLQREKEERNDTSNLTNGLGPKRVRIHERSVKKQMAYLDVSRETLCS